MCEGTGKRNSKPYYFARRRVNGDPHGQAPMLWIATELLAEKMGDTAGKVKTPATSKLFERRIDPVSKVVSYALLCGAPDDNRQSLYFVTKSMTEDGRFLLFWHTAGNERKPPCGARHVMMADLLKDEIVDLGVPSDKMYTWFVDCQRNEAVYADDAGVFWRLPFADPAHRVRLCGTPKTLTDVGSVQFLATHLTLTRDRAKAFLDVAVKTPEGKLRYFHGLLTLATGEWEPWGETDFCTDHGQINPANDRIALVAWEAAWEKQGREYKKRTGHYPRMWLVEPGNRRRMVPAEARNFASHEIWDDDGKGFSWCGWGSMNPDDTVYHCDLATGRQEKWCGIAGARHNSCSPDNRYVVTDVAPERWWRGCKWRVGFWNRETGKAAWVYTTRPALMPRNNQSKLHPDPHPHFVMNAKYVVSTASNADGHMDLYVTPVDQLIEMTR